MTAVVFAAGPSLAQAAYDAVNSDKVDGKHAVGAGATPSNRAGKLVATNRSGLLPNNIIAQAQDSQALDGIDSTGFLGASDTAWDSDKLDGIDSSEFLRSNAKAADSDKIDGLDANDLRVTAGGATGAFPNVQGCGGDTIVSYPLNLTRAARISATAWSSLAVDAELVATIQIQLLDSAGQIVARSNRVATRETAGNPTLYVGEVLFRNDQSAPYEAAAGNYTLRIFGDNFGLCDNTKRVQYQAPRLTHMLLAAGS